MTDNLIFPLPTIPDVVLHLERKHLTFHNEYVGRSVLSEKMIAQLGFDICENANHLIKDGVEKCFSRLTSITLQQDVIAKSKFAAVETKVFGVVDESTAIYSLGVLLRDLFISGGNSDLRLRKILDKACDRYPFNRHQSLRQLQEDFALYLRNNVDEEVYGVIITEKVPEPQAKERIAAIKDEPVHFQYYSHKDNVKRTLSKMFPFKRVQIILSVIFILFSSISIPLTSINKSTDLPTMATVQNIR